MEITNSTLDSLRVAFSMAFDDSFRRAPVQYDKLCHVAQSSSRSNIYGIMHQQVKLEEWVAPRTVTDLEEKSFELVNKKYQAAVEVRREHIEDDILGMYTGSRFPQLGEAAAKLPDQLLRDTLQSASGAGPTAFDGTALFSNSRDYGGGTIDNLDTGALTADNINTFWSTGASWKDADGEPLGVMFTHLVVPPQLRRAALEVVDATTRVVGSTNTTTNIDNVMQGWLDVVVMPELANDPGVYYLMDLSGSMKPLIFQERTKPELTSMQDLNNPVVFAQDVFSWGVRYRCVMGAGAPHLIFKGGS